jgi:glycosyltransferase involved in cell wall biosynthesis
MGEGIVYSKARNRIKSIFYGWIRASLRGTNLYKRWLLSKSIRLSPELADKRPRALVIDVTTPTPDRDSGSVDAIYQMKILQRLGYHVTFVPDDFSFRPRYTKALLDLGVQPVHRELFPCLEDYIELQGEKLDLVVISRVSCAARHIDAIRRCCPNAKVIFNTVDLHYLREARRAEVEGSAIVARSAEVLKARELMAMEKADATIVISEAERLLIQRERPDIKVEAIPYVREVHECATPFSERRDIVFIGGFLHAPNVDAAIYFTRSIWPLIRESLQDARFLIVGSNLPREVALLGRQPGVVIRGHVEDLREIFERCRLSVAPLRYGAGIKGKIGTSLCYGVPCVATPVAAEGMGLSDRREVLIAADEKAFASAVVEAYQDEALWNHLSASGLEFMRNHFSFDQGVERMKALICSITADLPRRMNPRAVQR